MKKKWFRNGDEIATFWNRINPYLSLEDFRKMFYEHLMLIKKGMVSMFNNDFKAGVVVFDKMEKDALEMAGMITSAIVKQFPYMFI